MIQNWPLYYPNILKVGNLDSSVGVCTMWTERETVAKFIKKQDYCVIGNLYGQAGITPMIRNIFAKPTINKIVLWGADLSRSGQSLINFMKNGVDSEYQIIGDEKHGMVEHEIPVADLELFRKSVEVINMRGRSTAELANTVKELNKKAHKTKPFSQKKEFPLKINKPLTFPSEQMGFRVANVTVAATWLKVLNNIMRFGRNKKTRYTQTNELKELLNLTAVITNENPDDFYFPDYLAFTKKDLDSYIPQVLTARPIPGIAYTYGQRLRNNNHVDQIEKMIELLKNRPDSKKMVAFTADVAHDWDNVNRGDTPCLTQIVGSVQDEKFFFTVHFRSQDMVHGWPRNLFSLRKLQQLIAKEAKCELGSICSITHSAHIYSDDYTLVEKILEKNYEAELGFQKNAHFEFDPRGNVVVSVEPDPASGEEYIFAKLYAPGGGLLMQEWKGKNAYEIYTKITDWDVISMPSHLIYIGSELQRAEYALEHKEHYHQDPAPGEMLKRLKR